MVALAVLAQLMLQVSWVLYTTFRFGWGPRDNGWALFTVGVVAVVVQGGLMAPLLRRFGERRLAFAGLATGTVAYLCYGLVTAGWVMYTIIVANFLSFAAGPALQAMISKAVGANEQGVSMAAVTSINSIMFVLAPLISTPAARARRPSAAQRLAHRRDVLRERGAAGVALLMLWRHFRRGAVAAAVDTAH